MGMERIERRTTCNRDCPDACGLVATVEDGRVTKLRGDPEHPVTRGFLCFRTSRFPELQNAPNRLTQPLLRRNGELVPVTMDEALDYAAERLATIRQESGPEAVFHYRSGGSLGILKSFADRFFEHFGPVTAKSGDVCSGAGEAAQIEDLGISDSNSLFDLRNARHIYLWGKNPFVSNTHLVPLLKEVRANGTRITLIDPVQHKAASLADEVITPVPGGDLWLALGAARVLLDEGALAADVADFCDNLVGYQDLLRERTVDDYATAAGVTTEQLVSIAKTFAPGAGPTAILVGWGMQRRGNGGSIVRALDALAAISGNLFASGGGCSFYFGRRTAFHKLHTGTAARRVREPMFGPDVLAMRNPKIRALWVTAGNPVCMLPDSPKVAAALDATEFVVVVDPFLTDTGRRADLVLPVPTLLEDDDLLGSYGHHWLAESRPVVPPPQGVLHEVELFQGLAGRLGLGEEMAGSIDDWKRRLLARLSERGVSLETLREGAQQNPFAEPLLFPDRRVHTPNGRVQLMTRYDLPPTVAGGEFPLWLFSNSTAASQASAWSGKGLGEHTYVVVHPDVAPTGCVEGDLVTVTSATGQMVAELRTDAEQRTDVAIMPKGGHFDRGHSANTLIEARPTDIGLGAAYLDCCVSVRAC